MMKAQSNAQKITPAVALSRSGLDHSLGYERRLHHPNQFKSFFNEALCEVLFLRHCTIFRVPNERADFRLGLTIKTKCESVDRNRVRRSVRESFRLASNELSGYDYNVVLSKNKSFEHPYALRLAKELKEQLKAGKWRNMADVRRAREASRS